MKKCNICGNEALYRIKGNPDFYCSECALEHFEDLSYLQKIEEETVRVNGQ
jgi:hypothetical protein